MNSYYLLDPTARREEPGECSLTRCAQPDHRDAKRCEECGKEKCPDCMYPILIDGMVFCLYCAPVEDIHCPDCRCYPCRCAGKVAA